MPVHMYEDMRCSLCKEVEVTGAGASLLEMTLGREVRTEYTLSSALDGRLGGTGSKKAAHAPDGVTSGGPARAGVRLRGQGNEIRGRLDGRLPLTSHPGHPAHGLRHAALADPGGKREPNGFRMIPMPTCEPKME